MSSPIFGPRQSVEGIPTDDVLTDASLSTTGVSPVNRSALDPILELEATPLKKLMRNVARGIENPLTKEFTLVLKHLPAVCGPFIKNFEAMMQRSFADNETYHGPPGRSESETQDEDFNQFLHKLLSPLEQDTPEDIAGLEVDQEIGVIGLIHSDKFEEMVSLGGILSSLIARITAAAKSNTLEKMSNQILVESLNPNIDNLLLPILDILETETVRQCFCNDNALEGHDTQLFDDLSVSIGKVNHIVQRGRLLLTQPRTGEPYN